MTEEQRNVIRKALHTTITHIARMYNVYEDDVKNEITKMLPSKDDEFILVTWPDIQYYYDLDGWEDNSFLVNDENGLEQYGSSAYFLKKSWYCKQQDIVDQMMKEHFEDIQPSEQV